MSERGVITGRMLNSDGTLQVTLVMDDGQPDQDGQVIPPDLMYDMATQWLDGKQPYVVGERGAAGIGTMVWLDGDKTMLEVLITESVIAGMLWKGAPAKWGLGFADPVYEALDGVPGGQMTGGTLAQVYLNEAPGTCDRCGRPEPVTLPGLYQHRSGEFSDVRAQMPVLYAWAHQPGVRIIELGVRSGYSTCSLLAGIERSGTGGELWSVDIAEPPVPAWWHDLPFWHQITAASLSTTALSFCPDGVDIVFNDASHYYDQTFGELQAYVPKIRPGGVYLLHDTDTMANGTPGGSKCPDVPQALDAFCEQTGLSWYQHPGWNGLGVIEIPNGAV